MKMNRFMIIALVSAPLCVIAKSIKQKAYRTQMSSRKSQYKVADSIINRWSPRAMSGESITDEQLMSLFEAARWAPSSYNNQPWRFIYAKRDTKHWQKFFDLLVPFNQSWCKDAAALVVVVSANNHTDAIPNPDVVGTPARTHSFDTGAAWQNIALQGHLNDLVVHGMAGFDYDKAKAVLSIPDDYTVEAMFAVGKPGEVNRLPKDLQDGEQMSGRKPVEQLVAEGDFSDL